MSIDRSRLPSSGAVAPLVFPTIERSTLPNGLRLWTARHDAVPLLTVIVLFRCGAADDPPGLEGLAAMTAGMLDEGSGDRSAIDMHEELAQIGAHLDTDVGADAAAISLTLLSRFAPRGLELLADMVAGPRLAEADFDRVRQLGLHRLLQLRDQPGAVADRAFLKLLYGGDPYGHASIGTEAALRSMAVDDVRAFHARALRPAAATIIAVGDCEHETIRGLVQAAFAGWSGTSPAESQAGVGVACPPKLGLVPRPGAPQSELRIGHVAAARNTPDYHALLAVNMVLGGQFVSRVNLNLREDKGFTYGARTAFDFRRRPGPFSLQVGVHTAATRRAIEESLDEIRAIRGPRPMTPDELALGVAALTRGYARNFETADQVARGVAQIALYDLPDTYFAEFVPRMEAVTAAEATRVAEQYLQPDRLTTLVVGDADAVAGDLDHLGLGAPIVLSSDDF